MKKNIAPSPYYHKPPLRSHDFEIHHNLDFNLNHITPNTHDYYEFYFLISGDVSYRIEQKNYHLRSGDVILIAPGQYHAATINNCSGQPYERYVLWLNSKYLNRLSSSKTDLMRSFQQSRFTTAQLRLSNDMQRTCQNLLQSILIHAVSQEYGSDLLIDCYIIELLVHIARIMLFQQTPYTEHIGSHLSDNPVLLSALQYIMEHIYENIKIQNITDHLYVSRSYLSKIFQDELGISIHQYIMKKKLFLARQELLNDIPIKEVYQKYCFGNYSSFFRAFKAEFGLSPRDLKKLQ